ncbi:hypothetical protein F66182_3525 [Fusarium sp. NRRL 66182]|nr:hypothetical protein F66182_3525 [Fusarium sp. NRRL 66182]
MSPVPHPLCPLTGTEIQASARLIKSVWPQSVSLYFKVITLSEPPKEKLAPYLEALDGGEKPLSLERRAFVAYYIRRTDIFHEAIVNLTTERVERNVKLGPNVHGNVDYDEAQRVEKLALEDPNVLAELEKLKLPEGTVVCADPWIYGSDGIDDDIRMYQVFLYMRDPENAGEADSNHYAFPLPISPVVECTNYKVVRIDVLPTGADTTVKPLAPYQPKPANEYIPESQALRKDLKPLHVNQPEGPSFSVTPVGETGNIVAWQKWTLFVGFNQREGMVLHNVKYDNRPLFYRLSLSDMSIPYADPRHPFHKKSAFDLGDVGAGTTANNLKLGCDCLGSIQYLSGVLCDDQGNPLPMENVICVHEQDAGVGWKHTNYRTGRAAVVRSRELVLQSILTVSNYEYILMFIFNQAGEVTYQVRATGILSTQPIDHELDKTGVSFGTVVHPGVLAAHHQHIFSLRVDPMIDGHTNQLVYTEAHRMPRDPHWNPHGIGYEVVEKTVDKTSGLDIDYDLSRTYKITNPNSVNPINGKPVGYKIMAPPFQKLMGDDDSFIYKRAEFADHNIYLTTHRDNELYAGGWYTNQSRGGAGVRTWAQRNEMLTPYSDIVLWVQFGINHIPRIEDFPVMPVEILQVHFKPVNFFTKNPALDVPPSEQSVNKRALAAQAQAATKLLSGATIIGWDDNSSSPQIVRNGHLLITDDRITSITASRPSSLPNNTEVVDVADQIISPGFIDTHHHGWQTAFKTLASNTTLAEYFARYGEFASAARFTAEDVYWGQLAGLYEALNAGVTTTLDHAHHTWSNETAYAGLDASIESGARVFWAYTFHDIPALNYTIQDQVPNFVEIAESNAFENSNVELGIAYDLFGPQPPAITKDVAKLAQDYNISVLTTHCAGGIWGSTNYPEDVHSFGLLNTSIPVVFSHASFLTGTGAELLRQTNQYVSITPESEMHYGHTHPSTYYIQDQAALGVDSHFTFSTDILTQARIWLQSVRYLFFDRVLSNWEIPQNNPMSVNQAFSLTTRAGGLALRRPDLGVIREGAKADLIVWNAADSPSLLGFRDPVAAVILHASVGDILHVLVNGEFVKKDGKLTAADYARTKGSFLQSAERIQSIWGDIEYPVLEGEFNGGGFYFGKAKVVDAKRGAGNGY